MDTTGPSTHVMGLRCVRMRIGVVDGVFGRSHAPAGEEGGAAIGNAIYTWDAGLRVRTGRGGRERTLGREHGAHDIVAPTTATAVGEDIYYPTPQRLN